MGRNFTNISRVPWYNRGDSLMVYMTGWILFGMCAALNVVIYWAICEGFETNFWREDETRKR